MTPRTRICTLRVSVLGCLTIVWVAGGCATTQFGPAIAQHAAKTAVTDASARHTAVSSYYRFNTGLLSDLDDAIECTDASAQRKMAVAVLRRASELGRASSANEIERMPAHARDELSRLVSLSSSVDGSRTDPSYAFAGLKEPGETREAKDGVGLADSAGGADDAVVLEHHFSMLANAALASDLGDLDRLPAWELKSKLKDMRNGIDDLPDDRGRLARKILYGWAAPLTAHGIAREEAKLSDKSRAKAAKTFDRVAIWRPSMYAGDALTKRYAPTIAMEWPEKRRYDAASDRIGAVTLSSDGRNIEVAIDPTEPTVYTYTTVAKIHGRRYRQLNYVWWFSERPEMSPDDAAAGHIDGAMIRITLDASDNPLFIESSLNCGCAHEVFVSEAVESAARRTFGAPIDGKHFSIEKSASDKHDIVVIHTFDARTTAYSPLVLTAAGYHEVCQITFDAFESINNLDVVGERSYRMMDYGDLDRLPLGDGIGSMFGPDGLVHHAARPEGILLAPSGMLSAGQPRKRGTQRIRWDDYLHDDPHLLENTLRMPALD